MTPHPAPTSVYSPLKLLVYSDNPRTRAQVIEALGSWPGAQPARLEFVESATADAVFQEIGMGTIDLVILDAEAAPAGGLGIAKQLRDELIRCPPIVALIGRHVDAWLADWSGSDAVVAQPIDPLALRQVVGPLIGSLLLR